MKNITFFLSLMVSVLNLQAQTENCDTIIMKDGKMKIVKIERRNDREIIYSDCNGKNDNQFAVYMTDVQEIRSTTFENTKIRENKNKKQGARLNGIYVAPSLYFDLYDAASLSGVELEPLFGANIFYDRRIHSFSEQFHIGFSSGIGFIDGAYSTFDGGLIMRVGPKLFFGKGRNMFTTEMLYFLFSDAGEYNYHGLLFGAGYAFTGKSGFFFHPKINFLSSMNSIGEYDDKVRFLEIQIGVGYSF